MKRSDTDTPDGHPGTTMTTADPGDDDGPRRRRCSVQMFTAIVSCVVLFWMIGYAYTTGVLRTLERRFGLSSAQSGLVQSSNDIMHVAVVVFIGYFGLRGNKPRIICVTASLAALGNLLMALPHWIFASDGDASSQLSQNESNSTEFCLSSSSVVVGTTSDASAASCADVGPTSSAAHPALYLLIVARMLNGLGNSGTTVLSVAYIDENTSKIKSPLYIGCVSGMMVLGPVCGLMLAYLMLQQHQNIASDAATTLQPGDPQWIGCWWLGYMVVAVGLLATSVPLWFFPSSMIQRQQTPPPSIEDGVNAHAHNSSSSSSRQKSITRKLRKEIKAFARALMRLFRNVPYLYLAAVKILSNMIIVGVLLNSVRYVEIAFHQPAFVASIISALSWSLAGALGSFGGGVIMSRLKLTPVGALRLIIGSCSGFMVGVVVFLFLGCPQIDIAGQLATDDDARFTVRQQCNSHCACSINRKSHDPVCGSDNLTYFSACFAGCTDRVNDTYVGCACVATTPFSYSPATALNSSSPEMTSWSGATARPGDCLPTCWLVVVYAVVIFFATVSFALSLAPDTVVNFRVVNDDERSFALAINSFAGNLIGYIPAPLLFGALIDSTCRLWERDDGGSSAAAACGGGGATGSCLIFDTDQLRWRTFGVALCIQLVQLTFVVLLYRAVKRRHFDVDDDDRHQQTTSKSVPLPLDGSPRPSPRTAEQLTLLPVDVAQQP